MRERGTSGMSMPAHVVRRQVLPLHCEQFPGLSGHLLLLRSRVQTPPTAETVYRSAFAEDRLELGERELHGEGGFRELRLRRLV